MPDRTHYSLTQTQRHHLKLLLTVGAIDRETSLGLYDPRQLSIGGGGIVPGVMGILDDKGFVDRKAFTDQPGGSRTTHYWLTEGGAVVARQILQGEI